MDVLQLLTQIVFMQVKYRSIDLKDNEGVQLPALLVPKGYFQVCHALHSGGDRRGHLHGGAPEDDACGPGLPGIGVFL